MALNEYIFAFMSRPILTNTKMNNRNIILLRLYKEYNLPKIKFSNYKRLRFF